MNKDIPEIRAHAAISDIGDWPSWPRIIPPEVSRFDNDLYKLAESLYRYYGAMLDHDPASWTVLEAHERFMRRDFDAGKAAYEDAPSNVQGRIYFYLLQLRNRHMILLRFMREYMAYNEVPTLSPSERAEMEAEEARQFRESLNTTEGRRAHLDWLMSNAGNVTWEDRLRLHRDTCQRYNCEPRWRSAETLQKAYRR